MADTPTRHTELPIAHVPVLLTEIIHFLYPQPGQTVVDGTVGAGGHAVAILDRLGPSGRLIGLDRDPAMLARALQRLPADRATLVQANFADLRAVLDALGVRRVDAVLLDLGISSDQLDDPRRGFSFQRPGPLDMRMDPAAGFSAVEWINRQRAEVLADVFFRFGEERYSRRVARAIDAARRRKPIETTEELAAIVRGAIPFHGGRQRIDPATRVFQALRILVNDELGSLERVLAELPRCVRLGGRAVIISFHSLEDRLVKTAFRNREVWEPLTKKPVIPSDAEVAANPRARSAKLRAATLIAEA